MIAIIIGIFSLMLLILVHERWHYILAKKSKVHVEEFGIGLPPRLCTIATDRHGTAYTLNTIPLGWFVRLAGEQSTTPALHDFEAASLRRKILILLWGIIMNILTAWLIFVGVFRYGMKPIQIVPPHLIPHNTSLILPTLSHLTAQWFVSGDTIIWPARIIAVMSGGVGASLGLQSGDVITLINTTPITTENLSSALYSQRGQIFQLSRTREQQVLTNTFQCPDDRCVLGVMIATSGTPEILTIRYPFPQAIGVATHELRSQLRMSYYGLQTLRDALTSGDGAETTRGFSQMTGPIGAIQIGSSLLQYQWWTSYLLFVAMISLSLAVFNALPLPALDGGRIVGVIITALLGRHGHYWIAIEKIINILMFVLLMGLGIAIAVKDIIRW